MVRDRAAALENGRKSLAAGGNVLVVDFADFGGLPTPVARGLRSYLRAFHVDPLDQALLEGATSVRFGPGRYYVVAVFGPLPTTTTRSRP